jgi:hypothetical protein
MRLAQPRRLSVRADRWAVTKSKVKRSELQVSNVAGAFGLGKHRFVRGPSDLLIDYMSSASRVTNIMSRLALNLAQRHHVHLLFALLKTTAARPARRATTAIPLEPSNSGTGVGVGTTFQNPANAWSAVIRLIKSVAAPTFIFMTFLLSQR